jgi:hypothetical protein
MDPKVGIIGFAFGLRAEEPNPSNIALAKKVHQVVVDAEKFGSVPIVVTQWEITKALDELFGYEVDLSVELRADGTYLDSKGVWEDAKAEFVREGVTQVIVVAQPFLHLPSLKKMVKDDGYEVFVYKIGEIPFDNSDLNTQPWSRSKTALAVYAAKSLLGMKHGRWHAERHPIALLAVGGDDRSLTAVDLRPSDGLLLYLTGLIFYAPISIL